MTLLSNSVASYVDDPAVIDQVENGTSYFLNPFLRLRRRYHALSAAVLVSKELSPRRPRA
jgi:hypothetical protein